MSPSTGPTALELDLRWAAKRMLRKCFRQAGDDDELTHHALAGVVKQLVGEQRWRRSPSQAVIDVIRIAIDRLPEKLSGRSPDQTAGHNKWAGGPERHMAELLYGYRDDELEPRFHFDGAEAGRTYNKDYLPAALELLGNAADDKRTCGRITGTIRQDLAAALLALKPEDVALQPSTTVIQEADESQDQEPYLDVDPTTGAERSVDNGSANDVDRSSDVTPNVDRPQYNDAFEALVSHGHKLIALVGEPGNGKSWLANHLVARRMGLGDTRVDLKANIATGLMIEIAGVLQRYAGHKVAGYPTTDDALARAFAALVSSRDAPTYIVIDNVEDPELVGRIVPPTTQSIVVVTSREHVLPEGRGVSLPIDEMEDAEARQLATHLLPTMPQTEIDRLAEVLGNKPLAIDHACMGLLADGYMSVEQFCTAFKRHAVAVMQQAKSPAERTLPFIYEQIVGRLREADVRDGTKVSALLELVVFVASEAIPPELLSSGLAALLPSEDISLAPVEFQAAQRELQRLHLVQLRHDGFAIHQFTQAMLRGLLHHVEVERCLLLHRLLNEKLADLVPGDALSQETVILLPHTSKALLGLAKIDSGRRNDEGIGHTIRILAQGVRQSGGIAQLTDFVECFLLPINDATGSDLALRDHPASSFIDDVYQAGRITRSQYVGYIARMLTGSRGQAYDIAADSYARIKLLQTVMLSYQYDTFNGLVNAYLAGQLVMADDERVASQGDLFRLMANAQAAQAKWKTALTIYRRAVQLYELDPDDLNCVRGKLAALIGIASTAINAGYFTQVKGPLQSANDLVLENESNYLDSPVVAELGRVTARAVTVKLMLGVLRGEQELPEHGSGIDMTYLEVFLLHQKTALGLHMLAVYYDWGCYRLLHGEVSDVREIFQEQAAKARKLEELDVTYLYYMGLIKIRIIEGAGSLRDIGRCLRISRTFLEKCHMSNRHADAVGTAYVVATTCGAPAHVIDSLRESARSAYEAIDKNWKFDLLDSVGTVAFKPMALFLP